MTSRPSDRPAPTELGDFAIVERLGEGGSGTVYAALWHDTPVALKVLRAEVTATDKERQRFVDEATKLRRVEHAALVRVLDAGTLPDGRPYLAMPRLHGETLHDRLQRGALPLGEAVAVFVALASGVSALHEAGIVHRDIKPENVFLEESDDGPPRPVLLDFGIAREVDRPDSTTTEAGVVRGTPAYMAPERFFGSGASVRTDVYELSVVLYAMIVGRLPWAAGADSASGRLDPRPPSAAGVAVPGKLETALLRALSTRPETRPASARDLAREIEEGLASGDADEAPRKTSALAATPPPPPPSATPSPFPSRTTGSTVIDARSRAPSRRILVAAGALAVLAALAVGLLRGPASVPSVAAGEAAPPAVAAAPTKAAPEPPANVAAVAPVPQAPPSYVVPKRYVPPPPRPRAPASALDADAGAAPADPARYFQDRK